MLTSEEIERTESFSIERGRERYSNEQLWARLIELNDRENEIVRFIPFAYRLAFSWRADCQSWRQYWDRLLNESSANRPVIELIVWHLSRRGDEAIADWLAQNAETQRELAVKAQSAAWRMSV